VGYEAILYGRIIGASGAVGENYRVLQDRNRAVINRLPREDDWPWLVRGMFALPGGCPEGTYRRQVIHFGASIKDDPQDVGVWDMWLGKFEALLRQLYWWSAIVHLSREFETDRTFEWTPTSESMDALRADPPRPVGEWVRTVHVAAKGQT
jgi:hypothetical protein